MKQQITALALALTVMCTGITTVYAHDTKAPFKGGQKIQKMKMTPEERKAEMQKHIDKFDTAIGLTVEQKTKANNIRTDAAQKIKPLVAQKKDKFEEIRKIRGNDDIKIKEQDKRTEKLTAEIKTIDQSIRQIEQDKRNAYKAILTAEQKTKLAQMKENHAMCHPKMHGGFKKEFFVR